MKELDRSKVYDLKPLNKEERNVFLQYLKNNEKNWDELPFNSFDRFIESNDSFRFSELFNEWVFSNELEPNTNAKELFYTLENVQVDCTGFSERNIKEMCEIFKRNGHKIDTKRTNVLSHKFTFLRIDGDDVWVSNYDENKTTINYDKFMELFGTEKQPNAKELFTPQYEVEMIAGNPKHPLSPVIEKALEMGKEAEKVLDTYIAYKEKKPQHYSKGIDTFARMEANCTTEECLAFAKGNIDKYNFRTKGQDLEDFKKIIVYANWAIKLLNNGNEKM